MREKKWQHAYKQTLQDEVIVTGKFAHLARYYGEDGILDLDHLKLPRRFTKYLKTMTNEAGICVEPLVTLEERDMLFELSNCKKTAELENLLSTWYSRKELSFKLLYQVCFVCES
ncbi:hypothetical protein INT47_011096 [Mucor saturninus]|uniref:Uncharacterized protein n=1 Tax=Mucor saturninus TaxID=64648 RepID=A0A8H7V3M5_9FUNG|nr:hypothetical protein INT47_011096 [Mucor saturninus]